MDFDLTEEQRAIVETARGFAAEHLAPHASAWERAGTIPREFLEQVGALGLGGIYVSPEHGGSGLSRLEAVLVFEALSAACPSVAAFISIHNMCAWMIDRFGSDAQRGKWLPQLCAFEKVASYCLTEPGSGSDAAALRTKAVSVAGGYRVSGTKSFISGGSYSDLYVVMCRTGAEGPKGISAHLIENGSDGLGFGALEHKMGWRAQPTTEVQLDDCFVPDNCLLGEEGDGFKYAMAGLDGGRLNISACSLGGAQAALDKSVVYVRERVAFGQPLSQLQSIQFKLADMEIELQASRTFLYQAASYLDAKSPQATKFCAMAKRFVTDTAFRVANEALQIHGGYGYLEDYGIEKIVRDLRVHQILEGTNEIMRVIVARQMLADN
ncbi:acyl-CoA dehydrogenase family protein [Martelella soudanensis]|uniref:acyl-CoA dehydrogenase family protein n=1 Tax=unclassified Martelella TaxID=2629616 RepID=UPI0015DE448A|nr:MULTISPECIES: acyl-CoA dehydrogenase family protein [unclassified Martelella]